MINFTICVGNTISFPGHAMITGFQLVELVQSLVDRDSLLDEFFVLTHLVDKNLLKVV